MAVDRSVTGVERFFGKDEVIVSKTDLKGKITYTNRVFINISGYTEAELLGAPHSILRHPDMPRSIFKLLWDYIENKKEIFAYVVNRCKNGDYYWVLAHITPNMDENGKVDGYHSNRRVPDPDVVKNVIKPLYKKIIEVEKSYKNAKDGMNAGLKAIEELLKEKGMEYDEFIFSIQG